MSDLKPVDQHSIPGHIGQMFTFSKLAQSWAAVWCVVGSALAWTTPSVAIAAPRSLAAHRLCATTHLLQNNRTQAVSRRTTGRQAGPVLSRPTQPGEAGRTGGFGHTYTTPVTFYDSPEGHFKFWYVTTGTDRPGSGHTTPSDADINGIPDWVERCSDYFEQSWQTAIDQMNYRIPPVDFDYNSEYTSLGLDNGGDGRYDVYIQDIGASIAGYTGPEQVISGRILPSYIVVDNDFSGVKSTLDEALSLLKATAAHELFHAIQFAYDVNEDIYWLEQTAVWMEEKVFDDVNDYYNYLTIFSGFLSQPWVSLDTRNGQHEFAGVLWPLFLSERHGDSVVREIWDLAVTVQSIDATDQALQGHGSSLSSEFQEFSVWNTFTGPRADPTKYYEEGALFPVVEVVDTVATFPSTGPTIPSSRFPSHLGVNYIEFTPDPFEKGGLQIDFDGITGQWGVSIVGISVAGPDTVINVPVSLSQTGTGFIRDWDLYDVILLAIASLNETGSGYLYTYTAVFDSSLVSTVAPSAVSVRAGPNPLYATNNHLLFNIALPHPGRVNLNVYNTLGQLMHSSLDPLLPAGTHSRKWDLTDSSGRKVPSGLYIYRFSFTDTGGTTTTVDQKVVLVK